MTASAQDGGLVPVNILTGFLGSGKTTLLRQALEDEALSGAAVLINEFGEVGIDHLLLERVDGDVVLLRGGCVCCTIRGDIADALKKLNARQAAGKIPDFSRVVIETTGLADPLPVLATLMHETNIRHHFRPAALIATVDAVNAPRQFSETEEAVRQVAMADRIVITKSDIASAEALRHTCEIVTGVNAVAPVCLRAAPGLDIRSLFAADVYDSRTRLEEVGHWLKPVVEAGPLAAPGGIAARPSDDRHGDKAQTLSIRVDEPIDWNVFGVWLSMLLHRHGDKIMRTKGILNVKGSTTPVVIHGVQNLVHPPVHLRSWPTKDRASTLVFIAQGLDLKSVEESLKTFLRGLGR